MAIAAYWHLLGYLMQVYKYVWACAHQVWLNWRIKKKSNKGLTTIPIYQGAYFWQEALGRWMRYRCFRPATCLEVWCHLKAMHQPRCFGEFSPHFISGLTLNVLNFKRVSVWSFLNNVLSSIFGPCTNFVLQMDSHVSTTMKLLVTVYDMNYL